MSSFTLSAKPFERRRWPTAWSWRPTSGVEDLRPPGPQSLAQDDKALSAEERGIGASKASKQAAKLATSPERPMTMATRTSPAGSARA